MKNIDHQTNQLSKTHSTGNSKTGRVIALFGPIAHIEPIPTAGTGGIVKFENDEIGLIWQISTTYLTVLLIEKNSKVKLDSQAELVGASMYVRSSDHVLGQTLDPMLQTFDGKNVGSGGNPLPVFGAAPSFSERAIVDEQLETGVLMVDTLFPIVKGQRIAVIGDNKTGKTTFMTQVAAHQADKDMVIVYVSIAKRRQDFARVQRKLKEAGVLGRSVCVVADAFDSLPAMFLAPYIGCSIAESFWRAGKNTLVIYDDLSAHAKVYRELSLLLKIPPGREGYPGDMFYTHASLLERAGKLKRNGASQTVLAAGTNPTGDLTGYLSTSLISLTDGQIVFDAAAMAQNIRPAINVNVSVSRVGGRSQSPQFQQLAREVMLRLANYRSARDFARFGADQSETVKAEIARGKKLYELFSQSETQQYSTKEQFIMLQALMDAKSPEEVSIGWLKSIIHDVAHQNISESDYQKIAAELLKSNPAVKQ